MDSRVRRNMDKPCRVLTIDPDEQDVSHREVDYLQKHNEPSTSDQMKSNRRYSNCEDALNYSQSKEDDQSVIPTARDASDNMSRLMGGDVSPSASCNASQILMKSLMKSYNAGNVQFYENLHKKYFDKAKGAKIDHEPPQALLDMTNDGEASKVEELSRFMADSRINNGSRSRSREGNSHINNLFQGSKISSMNIAGFSKMQDESCLPRT